MIEQVALADGTANASTGAATPASQSATQQVGTLFDLLLAALARQGAPPGNQASARTATAGGELHGGDSSDNLEAEADGITGKLTAALMAALGATGGARAVPKDTGSTTASATAKAPNSKLEALYAELGLEYSAGAPDLTLKSALDALLRGIPATATSADSVGASGSQTPVDPKLSALLDALGKANLLGQPGSAGASTSNLVQPVHVGIGSANTGANSSSSLAPATSPAGAGAGAGPDAVKTAQTGAAVTAPGETADKTAAAFSLPGKPAASTAQVPPTTDPKAVAQTTRPGTAATVPAPSDASAQPAPNQHAAGTEQPPAQPLTRAVEEVTAGAQVQAPAQAPASTRETHETAASIRSGQAETTSTQPVSAADGTAQQSGQQAPQSSPNHLAAVYTSQSQQTSSGAATPTNGAATQWQAPLRELAQTAQAVIRIAVRSRASNARITLKPAQLGSIEINLRYTSKGVSATLTGKSQAALSALTEAGADLRSALKQQGITLLSLDIHESAAEAPGTGPRQGDGDQLDKEAQTQNGTGPGDGDGADLEDAVQNSTRPTLGVVVDLFA